MVGQALLFIGRALFLNPIGLAVTVIAGAAYLIYRNWEPISAWFGKVWGKVKTAFSGAWDWFKGLPGQFSRLGSDLISGLVGGITAKLSAAKDTIVGFGQNIKGWFADTLGIKSPSRVFMGFGSNIGEGAQIGIMKGVPGVQGAVGKLAGVALAGAVAASGSAFAGVKQASQMLQNIQGGGVTHNQPAGAAGMTIHFAPTIHVGGDGDVRGQVKEAMQVSVRDLEQMLRRLQADQQRRAF
jgi:phage-related protein